MGEAAIEILGVGAVSAVGLTAPQTCAAIRAGVKRFCPIEAQILDYEEPRIGARVSADPRLRADEGQWLLNLAGRALLECEGEDEGEAALLWLVPEDHRAHPLCAGVGDSDLLVRFEELLGRRFAPCSRVLRSGAAGCIEALGLARELLQAGTVERCIIGGADSLLRRPDLDALGRANRLIGPRQSQGLVPGEGAAFVRVGLAASVGGEAPGAGADEQTNAAARIGIRGIGLGYEPNTVLGTEYSVGQAFVDALGTATQDADIPEPEIDFVAGNFNGERYDAWESSHANARGYETRREHLPVLWPAASTGEVGVAGGVLALIAAAAAIEGEYAAGPTAAVQVRSEGELRGVALIR
jgi:3-oxoacyl-[acyl-carrier-protein] synthase-1